MKKIFNHNEIARQIINQYAIITFNDTRETYYWNNQTGLYEPAEILIDQIVQGELGEECRTNFINEVKESIKRQTYISREKIGHDLNKIPIEKGVFHIDTEEIKPYTSQDIFLSKHPIEATESLTEPNPIDKFLEEVAENHEYILLLKEIVGYCFYRSMPFQNFFILIGKGANGKSVYLNLLKKILGEKNVSTLTLQTISEGSFELGFLYQKNANLIGDLPKKAFQDVGAIKELTGGDTITCKQKFKQPFMFQNYAKLISACNELPETPDVTDGFFRRAVIINFPNCFQDKANLNLLEELSKPEYLWDFFKTSINAFKLALERKQLIVNESTDKKRDKYIVYSNSAVAFCGHALEYDPEGNIKSELVYEHYLAYCKRKQVSAKNEVNFNKSLYLFFGNKVFKRRLRENDGIGNNLRVYVIQGLSWKESYELEPEVPLLGVL